MTYDMHDTCLATPHHFFHPEKPIHASMSIRKNCSFILTKGSINLSKNVTTIDIEKMSRWPMHCFFWKKTWRFSARCINACLHVSTPWPLLYSIYTYLYFHMHIHVYIYIQYIHIIIHPPNQQKNEQASQAPQKIPWFYMLVGKIGLHPWFSTCSGLQANGILKHLAVVSDHRPPFSNVRVPSWHSIESWLFNRDPYIYLDECLIFKSNVGKYTIHGFYGFYWLVHDGLLTMASCSSPT